MKKKTFRRTSAAVLGLTLASLSLMAGTMAKYTSTYTGTDSLTVAKWGFTVNSNETAYTENFALELKPTKDYSSVNSDNNGEMLAPGTSGSFTIVSTNDSDVAATYTITFKVTNKPSNLHFYYSNDITKSAIEATENTYSYNFVTAKEIDSTLTADGNLAARGDAAETETVVIYWNWAYESNGDETDTKEGINGQTMTVTATVTGTQVNPNA